MNPFKPPPENIIHKQSGQFGKCLYPRNTGITCAAKGHCTFCSLRFVEVHLKHHPHPQPGTICVDCHQVCEMCDLDTRAPVSTDLGALFMNQAAVIPASAIRAVQPGQLNLPSYHQRDHFCSLLVKNKHADGRPYFECTQCHDRFNWYVRSIPLYDQIPDVRVPVQLVCHLFDFFNTDRNADFYRKRCAAVVLQQAVRQFLGFPQEAQKAQKAQKEKLEQAKRAAITIQQGWRNHQQHLQLLKCLERLKRLKILAKSARLRRLHRAFQIMYQQFQQFRKASTIQNVFRSYRARETLQTLQTRHTLKKKMKHNQTVSRLVKWWKVVHPRRLRKLEQVQQLRDEAKRKRRRAKKKRQKLNKQQKKEEEESAPNGEKAQAILDEAMRIAVRPIDSLTDSDVRMCVDILCHLSARSKCSASGMALLHAAFYAAPAAVTEFNKFENFEPPPLRLDPSRVLGVRAVFDNIRAIGDQVCRRNIEGPFRKHSFYYTPYSIQLTRSGQVVRVEIPVPLDLAYTQSKRDDVLGYTIATHLLSLHYLITNAALLRSSIGTSVETMANRLVAPHRRYFAGIDNKTHKFKAPTVFQLCRENDVENVFLLGCMIQFQGHLHRTAIRSTTTTRTSPFFFVDAAMILSSATNVADVVCTSSMVTILAIAVANSVGVLCSDYGMGSDVPNESITGILDATLASIPEWEDDHVRRWQACVDVHIVRKRLTNPDKNQKLKRCVRALNKLSVPNAPEMLYMCASLFGHLHRCSTKELLRHTHMQLRDLVVSMRLGDRANSSNSKDLPTDLETAVSIHHRMAFDSFSITAQHLSTLLLVGHLNAVEILEPVLVGEVTARLLRLLVGIQQILQVQLHSDTLEPTINSDVGASPELIRTMLIWGTATTALTAVSTEFREILLKQTIEMEDLDEKEKDKYNFEKFERMVVQTMKPPNLSAKVAIEAERLDLHATGLAGTWFQILSNTDRRCLPCMTDTLHFLFTSACVVIERPRAAHTILQHMEQHFLGELIADLGTLVRGFFGWSKADLIKSSDNVGTKFINTVHRLLYI